MFPTECDVNIAIQNSMSGEGWGQGMGGGALYSEIQGIMDNGHMVQHP